MECLEQVLWWGRHKEKIKLFLLSLNGSPGRPVKGVDIPTAVHIFHDNLHFYST